eukprot:CAMPEP_0194705386 /NCGR_PEP_ID=MMETSP0295-20121207/28901_1 /TAXON_ID=39354 /ORGANISM="Heterosigma akashiwo, Strain CCMP2393" /LENGTH=180 /DNA_ID=CAMNT_0039601059 /DNA_START=22 /DNA_END=565 /DNA_ORIENTATION=-
MSSLRLFLLTCLVVTACVCHAFTSSLRMAADQKFELKVAMPPSDSGLTAEMRLRSILPEPSEIVEVRYRLPFGLNVEPQDGLAVCTKDGKAVGGEARATCSASAASGRSACPRATAWFFAGGLSWQCSLFDAARARTWPDVVKALTSNEPRRTDEVVLLFERRLAQEEGAAAEAKAEEGT